MAKQEERREPSQHDIPGKICPFCGGKTYQLAIGSIRRLSDSILFVRCRRCNHPRSFDAEFKRLLWINSKTRVWAMLLTITETIRWPFHHLHAYIDRRRKKRSTLQMLALSGAVRPSHVELRYMTPLLTVEGSTNSSQDTPAPSTNQSSLLTQFIELMRQLIMDLRSLSPYFYRGLSSFGVELSSPYRSLSVLPSTTALVVADGNDYPSMTDRASHEIVESRAAEVRLQQAFEKKVRITSLGGGHLYRNNVTLVDLPVVSRNGHGQSDPLSMRAGTVTVLRPGVCDLAERFESKVLPLFTRRTRKVDSMLPELYVQGLSTRDFDVALRNLLGEGAPLSEHSLQQLKCHFNQEYDRWTTRDLSHLAVAYWWADGLYVKAGLEDRKRTLLTIVGALTTGEKVVLACESGNRESKGSWLKLLRDLKQRGLTFPQLTVADGRLGLWAALNEIHPSGEKQGCWNHKIKNVLGALPKEAQPEARELLKAIPYAETQTECERHRDEFVRTYGETEKSAVGRLLHDWERMVTFYAFPQEHWRHIRTTNIVSSPFTLARIRTNASARYKHVESAKVIMWKMLQVAEQSWRKLPAPELVPSVASTPMFNNGLMSQSTNMERAMNCQVERPAA